MDQVDEAQRLEQIDRDRAIEAHRRQAALQASRETADDCDECGLEIPSGRQIAVPGTRHCTHCATLIENAARLGRAAL